MRKTLIAASVAALALVGLSPAIADAGPPSLAGSDFEIEADANIIVDTPGNIDWVSDGVTVKADKPSGKADDSFGQGTKENTAVPVVVSGSIPPNKSDLKEFGSYQEGTTADGFFHLFWSRVQDPSGTTNMDFELNQSDVLSSNGVTNVRTAGDLLITYDLDKGGKVATMSKREWDGSKWGPAEGFSDGEAVGTINTSTIPADSGLGPYSPRTFGEASVALSSLFPSNGECKTFGTAYVKSRSSDSFTAALKDFIAPKAINLTNCGKVNIVKKDDAGAVLAGAEFTLLGTDPLLKCTTDAAGLCSITDVPFGTYTVKETVVPTGYDPAPDQTATVSGSVQVVTLTFIDVRQRGAIEVTKTYGDGVPLADVEFTVNGVTKKTGTDGKVCFDGLLFGDYKVTETVPAGFKPAGANPKTVTVDTKASCSDATYVGETVSFVNIPLSQIAVGFRPEVAGATSATIECKKGSDVISTVALPTLRTDSDAYGTAVGAGSLEPGTYVCTVVIQ